MFRVAFVFFGKLTFKKADIYYGLNISLKNGARGLKFFLKVCIGVFFEILNFHFLVFFLPFVMFGTPAITFLFKLV